MNLSRLTEEVALKILSNIRVLCKEGITELVAYRPSKVPKLSSKKLSKLDYKLRIEAGFSYLWTKNSLHFVEVNKPSNRGFLVSELGITKGELTRVKVDVSEEMWSVDIPRLFYASIREAACNQSPGKVLLRDTRKILFPDVSFNDDIDGVRHGLLISSYRVDTSGIAFSADYIRDREDDTSENPYLKLLSPRERWSRTEALLEQMIPRQGLTIQLGGVELSIPPKSLSLDLREESEVE